MGRGTDLKQDILISVFCLCIHLPVCACLAFRTLDFIHWYLVLHITHHKCSMIYFFLIAYLILTLLWLLYYQVLKTYTLYKCFLSLLCAVCRSKGCGKKSNEGNIENRNNARQRLDGRSSLCSKHCLQFRAVRRRLISSTWKLKS